MQTLLPIAEAIARTLKARGETIAVAESSAGGLIAAALLAVPGASAYFLGGAVVYTRQSRGALVGITDAEMAGLRSSSEPYAALLARTQRHRHGATWGLAETGAAGPSGNRYGDAAGHTCIAVAGPLERGLTLETAHGDRIANMRAFGVKALETLAEVLASAQDLIAVDPSDVLGPLVDRAARPLRDFWHTPTAQTGHRQRGDFRIAAFNLYGRQ